MSPLENRDLEAAPRYRRGGYLDEGRVKGEHNVQPAKVLERTGIDGDEALEAFELEDGETITLDEKTNRKLLRKIGTTRLVCQH